MTEKLINEEKCIQNKTGDESTKLVSLDFEPELLGRCLPNRWSGRSDIRTYEQTQAEFFFACTQADDMNQEVLTKKTLQKFVKKFNFFFTFAM